MSPIVLTNNIIFKWNGIQCWWRKYDIAKQC